MMIILNSCHFGDYCHLVSDEWRFFFFWSEDHLKELHPYIKRNEMRAVTSQVHIVNLTPQNKTLIIVLI